MPKSAKKLQAVTDDLFHGRVTTQGRGVVALPAAVRRILQLDDKGSQFDVVVRHDGVIELRPLVAVPADEAWFWSTEWQAGEREAAADVAAGRTRKFSSRKAADAFLESLSKK
ncbi:MAG: hypothetical protein RL410_108 [Actinomycetota bacterium]|jgi:bifunctional DNA-binding transcriptional regulator/antitoxin component of YhaV-PrlF toxin-antitoxin module